MILLNMFSNIKMKQIFIFLLILKELLIILKIIYILKATFTTDITPLEFYKIIDHEYSKLELNKYTRPSELFKVASTLI